MMHTVGSLLQKAWRHVQANRTAMGKPGEGRNAVVSRTNAQSPELFFLFQGLAQKFMMDPLTFLNKTGLLDRNLVMLRDTSCSLYHGSIAEDLHGFESILAKLREYRQHYAGCTTVHCSGTSVGAYAAILFGYYLKADTVTAFGTPSLIREDECRKNFSLPKSWALPARHRDLTELLARSNGRTTYRLYYCQDYRPDRESAERLASFPGVVLHPQQGYQHNVVEAMDNQGGLELIFPPPAKHAEVKM